MGIKLASSLFTTTHMFVPYLAVHRIEFSHGVTDQEPHVSLQQTLIEGLCGQNPLETRRPQTFPLVWDYPTGLLYML